MLTLGMSRALTHAPKRPSAVLGGDRQAITLWKPAVIRPDALIHAVTLPRGRDSKDQVACGHVVLGRPLSSRRGVDT